VNQESAGVLAVIDMQRVFAEPDSPWLVPRYPRARTGIRRLLPAFGDRVVFTRFVAPDKPEGSWQPYYQQWSFALQPPESRIWELSDEFGDGPAAPGAAARPAAGVPAAGRIHASGSRSARSSCARVAASALSFFSRAEAIALHCSGCTMCGSKP
jgi:hypothetical protein